MRGCRTLDLLPHSASGIRRVSLLALRPPLLLCRTRQHAVGNIAGVNRDLCQRVVLFAGLALVYALFIWMFLSVAEADALGNAIVRAGRPALGERILVFAADWRHGLNGHSPLFMPGFFALTLAVWYWSGRQSVVQLLCAGALALAVGYTLASLAAPLGRAAAGAALSKEFHFTIPPGVRPAWDAVPVSAFTAICWTVLVVAIRRALTTGAGRPLALVVCLYALLGFARDWWSVDHFRKGDDVARWEARIAQGDAVAIGSVLAMASLALLFARTTRNERP
jgi:hypothetical protein